MQDVTRIVSRPSVQGVREAREAAQDAALQARIASLENQLAAAKVRAEVALAKAAAAKTDAERAPYSEAIHTAEAEVQEIEALLASAKAQEAAGEVARVISRNVAQGVAGSAVPPAWQYAKEITAITGLFTVFVLGPLAIAFAIRLVRRGVSAPAPQPEIAEMNERIRRIENAVDTIAVEIERVAEGQRFIAKSLPRPEGVEARR